MATPLYYVVVRSNGSAHVRRWLADHSSIFVEELPSREAAEAMAERLNSALGERS